MISIRDQIGNRGKSTLIRRIRKFGYDRARLICKGLSALVNAFESASPFDHVKNPRKRYAIIVAIFEDAVNMAALFFRGIFQSVD